MPETYQATNEDTLIDQMVDLFERLGLLAPETQPPIQMTNEEITERWNEISTQVAPYYEEERSFAQQQYQLQASAASQAQSQVARDVSLAMEGLGKEKEVGLKRAGEDLESALMRARQGYASRGLTFSGIRQQGEDYLGFEKGRNVQDIEMAYAKQLAAQKSRLASASASSSMARASAQAGYQRDLQQLNRAQRETTQSAFNELYPTAMGVYESFLR